LCAFGIVKKDKKAFEVSTQYVAFLDPQSSDYIGGLIDHEIHLHKRWRNLSESIISGMPVKKSDQPVKPEDTQRFIKAMANIGRRTAPIFLDKVKFKGNESLLDLGGGPGQYVENLSSMYPNMKITLFDQPDTIKTAQTVLSRLQNFKNIHLLSGNFLEDNLGENYDVIFSSNVIHIFGPKDVQQIFDRCYHVMNTGGRLLIKDFYYNDEHTGPEFASLFSIHMLLSTDGGQCYSEKEMIYLMEKSNFSHRKSVKLTENTMIIEGIK
jgi:cyclopropane fatty-acyl-phospholipid synthase-like methyltransferase